MVSKSTFYYSKIIALIVLSVGSLCLAHGMVTINESTPLRTIIDNHVSNHWKEEKITHQGRCDDSTFLRRIYLDLWGTIPSHDEAKTFLNDQDPKKREKLITFRARVAERDDATSKAANESWRTINLENVLGFLVGGQFIDLRDENDIME
ncbi:DUF1549 domain-containing protein, partial [bacterium]|nr:DUF1549 domain-containing protein [bacterium]